MKMRNRRFLFALVFLLMIALCACPAPQRTGTEDGSFLNMPTKQQALYILQIYNKQYEEYMSVWAKDDRTELDNEYLRNKKEALTEVYPYIDTFASYVDKGVIPPSTVEAAALAAVNKLLNI